MWKRDRERRRGGWTFCSTCLSVCVLVCIPCISHKSRDGKYWVKVWKCENAIARVKKHSILYISCVWCSNNSHTHTNKQTFRTPTLLWARRYTLSYQCVWNCDRVRKSYMEALKSFVYQDWLTNTHTRFVRTYTSINRVRDRHDNQQSNQFNELPCEQRLKDIYSFWWTSSVHSFFFTPQSWLTRAHLLTSSLSPIHTHTNTRAQTYAHTYFHLLFDLVIAISFAHRSV